MKVLFYIILIAVISSVVKGENANSPDFLDSENRDLILQCLYHTTCEEHLESFQYCFKDNLSVENQTRILENVEDRLDLDRTPSLDDFIEIICQDEELAKKAFYLLTSYMNMLGRFCVTQLVALMEANGECPAPKD